MSIPDRIWSAVASRPLTRPGSSQILVTCLAQLAEVMLLWGWPDTIGATPLLGAAFVFHLTDRMHPVPDGHSALILGGIVLVTALMAAYGTLFRVGWARIFVLLPQQFVLGAMAAGGLFAAWEGSYLDSTVVTRSHILGDQLAWAVIFVLHGISIYRRSGQVD